MKNKNRKDTQAKKEGKRYFDSLDTERKGNILIRAGLPMTSRTITYDQLPPYLQEIVDQRAKNIKKAPHLDAEQNLVVDENVQDKWPEPQGNVESSPAHTLGNHPEQQNPKQCSKREIEAMTQKEYPEELTFEEFDSIKWDFAKQFGLDDDRPINQIVQEVKEFAKKTGGQIYTQVDGETDIIYSRGLRFANRTGLYDVVKLEGYAVDNI